MHRHTLTWILIVGVISLMFTQLPQMAAKQDAILNTYSALVEVDALAKQAYVDPVIGERLVHGAIRGMMYQLDPYSGYISPDELPAFRRRTSGSFIGVGMELGIRDGKPTIIAPIEGGPAARAGVWPGDILRAIDGREVEGWSIFDIEERLGGNPRTTVAVSVWRRGEPDPLEFRMVRGPVHIDTVRGFARSADGNWEYFIDDGGRRIGYIRISSFHETTIRDFDHVLGRLCAEKLAALVLDLRFNAGGLMDQAVHMADRFLDDGLLLATVTRRRAVHEYFALPHNTMTCVPMVVLINAASASSSEIVAGALQDHGRAAIVGERSFGKGSVQQVIFLKAHEAAVKLTVAYYRLPSGRIIHRTPANERRGAWGITPDFEVPLSESERRAIRAARWAVDVPGADHGANGYASDAGADQAASSSASEADALEPAHRLPLDRQLQKALELLKS